MTCRGATLRSCRPHHIPNAAVGCCRQHSRRMHGTLSPPKFAGSGCGRPQVFAKVERHSVVDLRVVHAGIFRGVRPLDGRFSWNRGMLIETSELSSSREATPAAADGVVRIYHLTAGARPFLYFCQVALEGRTEGMHETSAGMIGVREGLPPKVGRKAQWSAPKDRYSPLVPSYVLSGNTAPFLSAASQAQRGSSISTLSLTFPPQAWNAMAAYIRRPWLR